MEFSGIWCLVSSSGVCSVEGFSGVGFVVSSSAGGVDWASVVGGPSSSGTGERRMRSGTCAVVPSG